MKKSIYFVMLSISTIFFLPAYLNAHEESLVDQRDAVCLKEIPVDPSFFKAYVKPYVQQIIEKHGLEEWKAVLLTNELHRHLGLWSIVGAKMGIRAKEILAAPFDAIEVISHAGYKPPYSCINDGIQVSTGASLGRGTITVAHLNEASADFIFKDKRVTLKAKPDLVKLIGGVIKDYSNKYGFQSPRYFQELDKISVEYWFRLDRKKIFDEIIQDR